MEVWGVALHPGVPQGLPLSEVLLRLGSRPFGFISPLAGTSEHLLGGGLRPGLSVLDCVCPTPLPPHLPGGSASLLRILKL